MASSDTELVVSGHPTLQPAPSCMAGTWGHLCALSHVPCCHLGAGAGSVPTLRSPTPVTTPAEGPWCAMRLPGAEGVAELWCCDEPLSPQNHPHPCPHPQWVSQPQDRQHLELCATAPELEPSQHQGPGSSSCWQKLGHAMSPGGGSMCPERGPSSRLVLGQGCGWGAQLSLQHPSSGWGVIALIRVISLAQLKSSSRLESVRAACWLLGNRGVVLLWQCWQPRGPDAWGAPREEERGDVHSLGRDGDIPGAERQQDMPKRKMRTCCGHQRAHTLSSHPTACPAPNTSRMPSPSWHL